MVSRCVRMRDDDRRRNARSVAHGFELLKRRSLQGRQMHFKMQLRGETFWLDVVKISNDIGVVFAHVSLGRLEVRTLYILFSVAEITTSHRV